MTLYQQHEEAMNFSFRAKQARENDDEDKALTFYQRAAEIESIVAEHYFDKPELEPTRSIIIRSAGFLNLKAGDIEKAERYIFWGMANTEDKVIREQFYDALEICLAYRKIGQDVVSKNVDYIFKLRQKSIFYIIEPQSPQYGNAVTLEMLSDFSSNFTKSLKAYSRYQYRSNFLNDNKAKDEEEEASKYFEKLVNPLITTAGFGSFRFSLAADFLPRLGEGTDLTRLKSNILINYHKEVFTKDLTKENIKQIKLEYPEDDISNIFRPIFNIRSNNSNYKVGYYDRETIKRVYLSNTNNKQKADLLPAKVIDAKDIGLLQNIIAHTRTTEKGHPLRSIILRQELKTYSFDYRTNILEPNDGSSIILTQEIVITIGFDSEIGFSFNFEDLPIEAINTTFNDGLKQFYTNFINFIKDLLSKKERSDMEEVYLNVIRRLVVNPQLLS